jgi:16S rRNA (adenine1518-N6/adenine1519-N6)-dimethyltransferase
MSPKSLGQHFLINRNIARKMVRMFGPGNHPLLEIGAGKGVLSELLLQHYPEQQIILVEKDSRLHARLEDIFGSRCRVIGDNILNIRLDQLPFPGKFSLIGNIPYYLSKDIIDWVIGQSGHVSKGLFMMQKEFVDKLVLRFPSAKSSARGVMFNYRFLPSKDMDVNPGSFFPSPKVVSSIFSFRALDPDTRLTDDRDFYRFLKICFGSRRKTLANNLGPVYGKEAVRKIFKQTDTGIRIRAEELDMKGFIRLFLGISAAGPGD